MRRISANWRRWQSSTRSFADLRRQRTVKLVIGLLLLSLQTAHAQPIAVNPEVQPAGQTAAPGLAYNRDQMWKRLIAIAEGPVPTREELEKEFGFTFRFWGKEAHEKEGDGTYYGTAASPPFATPRQPQGNNISYYAFEKSTLVVLHFDPKWRGINKIEDRYCVENEYLFKALTGKWVRNKKERWHSPIVVEYTAEFNGVTRVVTVSPLYLNASNYPCLDGFYIDYVHPTTEAKK